MPPICADILKSKKMKNKILIMVTVIACLMACNNDDDTSTETKSDAKQLTSFVFRAADNPAIDTDVSATIDENNKTISATLPDGTDVTDLIATITVSPKATVSPTGAQDFTNTVSFTITAEDGSTSSYTASVTVMEIAANEIPGAFSLLQLANESTDVVPTPTFTWEAATDPDGDTVTYDFYLDNESDPVTLVAEGLPDTTFTVSDTMALSLVRTYYWKVVAKDGEGGETSSEVFSFTTRTLNNAQQVPLENNGYFPREFFASVVFDDKMWILGGNAQGRFLNDAWSSADGQVWTLVNAQSTNTYEERFFHDAAVYEDNIQIAGGNTESGFSSSVSFSEDGIDWFQQDRSSTDGVFKPRAEHTLTAHDGKLWVIGGGGNDADGNAVKLADVWKSESQGIDWQRTVEDPPFVARNLHQTVSFQDNLWVIGGFGDENTGCLNDVWHSSDGITWAEATPNASFSPRGFHTALVFDDKIWVIGGAGDAGNVNDVWYSEDGKEWVDATPENSFPVQGNFKAQFFENKIWLLFESGDVWTIDYHSF